MKNKKIAGLLMCGVTLSQICSPILINAKEINKMSTETKFNERGHTSSMVRGYSEIPTEITLPKNSAVSKMYKTKDTHYGMQIQALRTSEEQAKNVIGNNIYNLGYGAYTVRQTGSYAQDGSYTEVDGEPKEVRLVSGKASVVNLDETGDGEYTVKNTTRVPGFKKDNTVYKYQYPHTVNGVVAENQDLVVSPKLNLIKGDIEFTKTDGKGQPLQGVKFELHRVVDAITGAVNEDVKVGGISVSDSKGKVKFTGLTEGLYYAQEISTVSGYVKDTDKIFFEVFALDGNTYANTVESFNKKEFSPKLFGSSEKIEYEKLVKNVYGDYAIGKTFNKIAGFSEQEYFPNNEKDEEYPVDPDNGGKTPDPEKPVDPDNGGDIDPDPEKPTDPDNGGGDIDPDPEKPVDPDNGGDIPVYTEAGDFTYDGGKLTGFSEKGQEKYDGGLRKITLPAKTDKGEWVTSIGDAAFFCKELSAVEFRLCEKLTAIGEGAFYANKLTGIDLRRCPNLKTIYGYAFYENNIQNLNLSNFSHLESIEYAAFYGNQIKHLNMKNCPKLWLIGDSAFYKNSIKTLNLSKCVSLSTLRDNCFTENDIEEIFLTNVGEHLPAVTVATNAKYKAFTENTNGKPRKLYVSGDLVNAYFGWWFVDDILVDSALPERNKVKMLSDSFLIKLEIEAKNFKDMQTDITNKVFVREVTSKIITDTGGNLKDELMFAENFYNYKVADITDNHTEGEKAGDDIHYTAEVNIPYNIDEYKSYTITDTTTRSELNLSVTSIKLGDTIFSGDEIKKFGTVTKQNGGFIFNTTEAQRQEIHKELDRQGFGEKTDRETGAILLFTIEADNLYDLDEITNTIKVDWRTASDSGTDTDTEKTHTQSAGLAIHKVDGKKKEQHLSGAEFELYILDEDIAGNSVAYSDSETTEINGKTYRNGVMGHITKGGNSTSYNINNIITGEDGIIEINHLRPARYILVETKAPAGYRLNSTPIEIDLRTGYDTNLNNTDQSLNVYNYSQNGYMPATGTTGILLSLVAVNTAGLGIVITRKKSKKLEEEEI